LASANLQRDVRKSVNGIYRQLFKPSLRKTGTAPGRRSPTTPTTTSRLVRAGIRAGSSLSGLIPLTQTLLSPRGWQNEHAERAGTSGVP